jgi:hypothetical protein
MSGRTNTSLKADQKKLKDSGIGEKFAAVIEKLERQHDLEKRRRRVEWGGNKASQVSTRSSR